MQPRCEEAAPIEPFILGLLDGICRGIPIYFKKAIFSREKASIVIRQRITLGQNFKNHNNMGRKFIVEEVEEKSEIGCGSIIAMAIIVLIIALCGGFKSSEEDTEPKNVEKQTEEPQRSDEVKVQIPPYVPKDSHTNTSTPAPTTTSTPRPQQEIAVEPITGTNFDDDAEPEEALVPTTATENEDNTITETDSKTPALTDKERRKAERQAKRKARRREKEQKHN